MSRALYRYVGPWVEQREERGRILAAAEVAVGRVQDDPECCQRMTRWLFGEIRHAFPLSHQAQLRRAVCTVCEAAARQARWRTQERLDFLGRPRRCAQLTRRGTPCRREPMANGCCPSHQHLVETGNASCDADVQAARIAGALAGSASPS